MHQPDTRATPIPLRLLCRRARSEQLPREAASFCSSGVQQPLYRREGISLRRAPFHYGVVQIFRYADRQQSSLADMVQRAIQTIVFDEEVGVADLDRKSFTTWLMCSKIGFIAYAGSSRSSMRRMRAPSFHSVASV